MSRISSSIPPEQLGHHTFALVGRPSFWKGLARTLDLGGTLRRDAFVDMRAETDAVATGQDWQAVGDDLHSAITHYGDLVEREVERTAR